MPTLYVNGRYVPESRARISADDHALAWGVGLFEVLRAYNGNPFRLADHVTRLRRSAKHFGLKVRLPNLPRVIDTLLKRNRLRQAHVRITVTEGGSVIVAASRWQPPPRGMYRRGASLRIAPWRRDPRSPLYGHKTLNYFENILARKDAHRRGALDTIFLGLQTEVLEGATCNVFLVQEGRLITPTIRRGILPGVTRQVILECARRAGIRVQERGVPLRELLRADEVFVTNAMIEVMPVAKIDRKKIGPPGPVTNALAEAYRRKVESVTRARRA